MPEQPDRTALWSRLDEHSAEISSMRERQAGTDAKLESLERRIDRQYAELTGTLGRMEAKQDETRTEMAQSRGGIRVGLWLFGAWATVSGLVVTAWAAIRNMGGS